MPDADGKYKIKFGTGSDAFTDGVKTAVDLAGTIRMQGIEATVWEKDRSGWMKIWPGPMGET